MLTIAANKDEGEGIAPNVTGVGLEEDGLVVAAIHAAGVLTSGQGRVIAHGGGDRRQDVAQLLLDGVPINEGAPGLLGISTQTAGVAEGPAALLLLGVQHGGIVGAEFHQQDLGVVDGAGAAAAAGGCVIEDLVVRTAAPGLPVVFGSDCAAASLIPIVLSVHSISEVSTTSSVRMNNGNGVRAFAFFTGLSFRSEPPLLIYLCFVLGWLGFLCRSVFGSGLSVDFPLFHLPPRFRLLLSIPANP